MRYAELLELAPDLRSFAAQIPENLDGLFHLKSYPAHTLIHQKDSPLERIGILLQGTFRVVNEFENGNVFMIEMNEAVSFIGEVTLLAGAATTSVTIETVTDCLVASLPVETFDEWLRRDIGLLRAVSRHVAAKLYCSSYSRGERLFYSAKYVLLKYLVRQAEEHYYDAILMDVQMPVMDGYEAGGAEQDPPPDQRGGGTDGEDHQPHACPAGQGRRAFHPAGQGGLQRRAVSPGPAGAAGLHVPEPEWSVYLR